MFSFNRIQWMMDSQDQRLQALTAWAGEVLGEVQLSAKSASGDASFRRYFRFECEGRSWIGMDAPPEQEPLAPFLQVAAQLTAIGLNVPLVHAQDAGRGFLLLSDLGTCQYLEALESPAERVGLYTDALQALVVLQYEGRVFAPQLPPYDEALLRQELTLFPDWYLQRQLGIELRRSEVELWEQLVSELVAAALAQPTVAVHRDYHSRNLMVTAERNPGILDFQDAVFGPLTYDLVSLLEDCYLALPESLEQQLMGTYREMAENVGLLEGLQIDDFVRAYDLMGIQRHLKAAGIFARLNQRDGKPGYLADIPRTLAYVLRACQRHDHCRGFAEFLLARVPAASLVQLP
jgi:aminoglycoside/choline kinase family phosphotransferase